MYVRPYRKAGNNETLSLLHELGHRYWRKFADKRKQQEWVRYHNSISAGAVPYPEDLKLPQVGEVVEMAKAKGRGRNRRKPIVTKIEGDKIYVDTGGFYRKHQFYEVAWKNAQREALIAKFPSAYSSKSYEEHFCEALAHRAAGSLAAENKAAFDAIWG